MYYTFVRIGDGTIGNTGFGTGQLLATLSGTSGFIDADVNVNLFAFFQQTLISG
ncbi:hypothetical protein [Anabaena lutea]|uniref:Uncharacterized protein n=1 Tax=Anabaena lutea FACHB-196 TaxID=2692881 RepID=A0ABR8FJT9_9NOST|nr:hypothetical protein [Anabaena lutea]MBD2569858.1 hypothetical protein [Anabaena lutea FACHB-196]